MHPLLQIGTRISVVPVIHGSVESALQVRRVMLEDKFDCLAVPLPPSFQESVEAGIRRLPTPTLVVQKRTPRYTRPWSAETEEEEVAGDRVSYVPIDPCQSVIAGLRVAMGEHIPRAFIDLETDEFHPYTAVLPDDYALQRLRIERFAAAILPFLPRPAEGQITLRIRHMARQLDLLQARYSAVLFVCSILHWPWIRESLVERHPSTEEHDYVEEPTLCQPDPRTLLFMLGELPFITGLHELARAELDDDEQLSIDGVKELLLAARTAYRQDFKNRARSVTAQTLACMLKYIRNLTLLERRFKPDLYTIVMAAKQVVGDSFALHVAETARAYPFERDAEVPTVTLGIDKIRFPDGDVCETVSRLPGPPLVWRSCELHRRPEHREMRQWQMQWNPWGQCSWPPEDNLIENFRAHVTQKAETVMGADLVRTEKFTTSVKDGIDIRDTLRNWHTGDIYVKVLPPNRGTLDAAVMLFDSPADPRSYPWRTTWFAEHQNESTLAFFATDFMSEIVGPGIGVATYGGALFLFPPVAIPDIWVDQRLDFADTLEERLLAAACVHSACPQIAVLSAYPPSAGWRRLAKRFKKRWVHIPLSQFSSATVHQLRMVHVLNGHHVRSYASHFIRKA